MRELVLHIGMSKAGSTAIQSAFYNHRDSLAERGLHYLRLGRNHSRAFQIASGYRRRSRGVSDLMLDDLGVADGSPDRVSAAVRQRLAETGDLAFGSGEGLFHFNSREAANLAELVRSHFDRVRILAYLREPIAWASSRAQQAVKSRLTEVDTLAGAVDQDGKGSLVVPNYRFLENYEAAFGRENLILRPFVRAAFPSGDLLTDVLHAIGRPDLVGSLASERTNPALSQEAVLLVEAFAARYGDSLPARTARDLRQTLEAIPGTSFALPRETLEKVYELCAGDLAWLKSHYGIDLLPDGPRYPDPGAAWGPATREAIVVALADAAAAVSAAETQQSARGDRTGDRSKAGPVARLVRGIRRLAGGKGRRAHAP